jgi:2-polyprenyl-3-methyl-5-hydroxy-6-metoxy-1,4-benzoquinol methylase
MGEESGCMEKHLQDHIEHYRCDGEAFDYFSVENPTIREEEHRRIELLARVMKLKGGEALLDAGSGGGWVSQALLPKGIFVCAVDLSKKNLAEIRKRFDFQKAGGYIVADLYHLPFKRGSFDAATSNDVYEHLEFLDKAVSELRAVLKNSARTFISVPYRENIIYYLCIHCNKLTPINAHLHSFDENNLGEIFTRNGFEINKIAKFMNKGMALLQVYRFSRWMPYSFWRALDVLANTVIRKPGRMAMMLQAQEK